MREELLKRGERLDDLQVNGLKLIQASDGYRFTSDAVRLVNFAGRKRARSAVDLGAGSGIIAVMLAGKFGASEVVGVEIQPRAAETASRNAAYNNLSDKIKIINASITDCGKRLKGGYYDLAVCNPPYRKAGSGDESENEAVRISRCEVKITLPEIVRAAAYLIKFKGRFCLSQETARLAETVRLCYENALIPKIIILYRHGVFCLEAVKGAAEGVKVLYGEDG